MLIDNQRIMAEVGKEIRLHDAELHGQAGVLNEFGPVDSLQPSGILVVLLSLRSLTPARAIFRSGRTITIVKPHSELSNLSPVAYAKASTPEKQRDGALRYMEGSASHPVALPSQQGSNQPATLLITG